MHLEDIREYAEGGAVEIGSRNGRPTVVAWNQDGFDGVEIDLLDLIEYLREHEPELL